MADELTTDDKQRLTAIMDTHDPERLAALVYDYYRDNARSDRTSRSLLYFHMGMLAAAIMRAVEKQKPPLVGWGDTREKSPS